MELFKARSPYYPTHSARKGDNLARMRKRVFFFLLSVALEFHQYMPKNRSIKTHGINIAIIRR